MRWRLAAAAACLAMVGCSSNADSPPPSSAGGADPVAPAEAQGMDRVPANRRGQVAMAVADLVEREGIAAADIRVLAVSEVTWPDGALGCPEPGMMYTQALVPGYRIVLAAGTRKLVYHGAGTRPPRWCAKPASTGYAADV